MNNVKYKHPKTGERRVIKISQSPRSRATISNPSKRFANIIMRRAGFVRDGVRAR